MIRVHVICEGQTEEMFVKEVLGRVFLEKGVRLIPALIGRPGHKGGNFKFTRLLMDVKARLLGDRTAFCTTLFDYYGLPADFPGKAQANTKNLAAEKAECVLKEMHAKLLEAIGDGALRRFIPYVQMHEFEGLLFSDPQKLAKGIDQADLAVPFQKIRDDCGTPEEINNGPDSAPSKRIARLYPGYDKPIHGSLAAFEIGLDVIRLECPMFDAWLRLIEGLQAAGPAG